ncbi:phosphopantetheine adenylyltransferase [Methanoculleus sp. FWC-SCC1]|uniref:Phosphopantetheine adenylyltransferase n=1 Tax=Methanoculleus frigidifontis TaxID=2584085 RepID=A0ABT8M7T5_9EURY|nr:phosphopantetheine adenylyltransferase [Methanoculleus sp. FWC-SCC1]MDN7023999.1 phosphopantetheine adenylyltransferase [Methanoculleus sp. FWC-SCC1]
MRVMVGGTFDPLHAGHKKLLVHSFQAAGSGGDVTIGITTDAFAGSKTHPVRPYAERMHEIEEFIRESGVAAEWHIEPLSDRFGSALEADFDVLVVSEETYPVAVEINERRRNLGRKEVDIHEIRCVLAEDGRRISSTRIHRGEIDRYGRVIR